MNALIQKFWRQLGITLDAYWQQLTVGQSSYTGSAADENRSPVSVVEAAEALVDADLLVTSPGPAEDARS